jgi:hypothetical protein
MEDHIDPQQYGGKKGSSTVYALIQLLHEWYTATDTLKTIVDVVLIDFAKVFDHINQNIIVNKLTSMNVPPIITNWIAAFLHNRKQRVKIGPITSSWLQMNGGVPQGLKLGVALFICMINDLKQGCFSSGRNRFLPGRWKKLNEISFRPDSSHFFRKKWKKWKKLDFDTQNLFHAGQTLSEA